MAGNQLVDSTRGPPSFFLFRADLGCFYGRLVVEDDDSSKSEKFFQGQLCAAQELSVF